METVWMTRRPGPPWRPLWARTRIASATSPGCCSTRRRPACCTAPRQPIRSVTGSYTVPRCEDGRRDWTRANEYLRTFLPVHAAAGGLLDALLTDAGFLAVVEPGRLLAALPAATTQRGLRIARLIERVGQQLLRHPRAEQICYLQLSARMCGDELFAQQIDALDVPRPWSVLWARWTQLSDGRVLAHHDDYVHSVAVIPHRGEQVVVSASTWMIAFHRLADGRPTMPALQEQTSEICASVAFGDAGQLVCVTLRNDGELHRIEVDPPGADIRLSSG